MQIFINVMLPVLLIFSLGFVFQRIFHLNIHPLSTLAIYLLLPFLIFQVFYRETINKSFLVIVIVTTLILTIMIIICILLGKIFEIKGEKLNALLLSSCFPNSGNYGVPVIMFAFGTKGLIYGMPIMIFHNILMGTVGVYIASNQNGRFLDSLKMIFKQPMNYVIIPAILLNQFDITIPKNFMKVINMIGNTAIPIIMLILGMQLADAKLQNLSWFKINLALILKLAIFPLIAFGLCQLLSLNYLLTAIIVIMSAMPSAANTTLYAVQFNLEPQLVSACTFISSLFSIFTLTFLINIIVN